MPDPIGDAKSGGVGKLPPPQEQKTGAKDESQSGNASPPKSGVAGLSCPAVSSLPDAPPATHVFGTNVSGVNGQNQGGMCYVQPSQPPAQTLPGDVVPAALIANCRDVGDVVEVLQGLTSRNQQAYAAEVVNLALRRFGDADQINKLAKAVKDNPALRPIVVEQILRRAAELDSKSTPENRDTLDGPHHRACAYVLAALKGMQGKELGALIAQKLSAKEGEWLAKTLDVRKPAGINGILSQARHQILSALNSVSRTDTTGAVVQTLYLRLLPEDIFTYCPPLAESLAIALGREFYPQLARTAAAEKVRLQAFLQKPEGLALMLTGTEERRQRVLGVLQKYPAFTVTTFAHHTGPWVTEPTFAHALGEGLVPADAPNRAALVQHIGEILATEQGQEIRFGWYGFDNRINLAVRVEAMQAIIDNGITAEVLRQTNNPWENEVLVKAIAAKRMAAADINADVPIKFKTREDLTNFVAFTSGLEPSHPKVKPIVDQLFAQGGKEPVVSFRPVFFSSRTTGVVQFPLYRTDVLWGFGPDQSGQDQFRVDHIFVDDVGRAYKTESHTSAFDVWQGTNKLPPGVVVCSKAGRISRDETGALALEVRDTPEKRRGAENAVTAAMMVGGMFAGGLTLVGAGSWIVSGIGVASSLHGAGTAWAELDDRRTHGQSNAWSDPEGRALKLNLAASVAGLGMFASGPVLKNTLYSGRLTHEAALAHSLVNAIGAGTDAAAFANGVVHLTKNYKQMSPDDIGLALLQLGWQALMSGVGVHQAGGLGATFNPMAGARMLIAKHLPPPRIHYRSTEVAGNAVEIRLVDGHRYEIFAGPQADQARIDHHINVVRQIEGDITFTEMLARWLGARSGTERESIAADISKLVSWIAQQRLKLASPDLPPGERDAIARDIASCMERWDELTQRWVELRNRPDSDRGGQPILLPDSTYRPGNAVTFVRTRAHDLYWELSKIDPPEFNRAVRETGAHGIDNPERLIDWYVKNGKFANRSMLDRALSLPDYEKAWQQFLNARAATESWKSGQIILSVSPETRLALELPGIDPKAYTRAEKAVGKDAGAIVNWFIKNEGLGTKKKYEQVWQNYLSSLAKERQRQQQPQPQPVVPPFLQQLAIAHEPPAPPVVTPVMHEPDAPTQGEGDLPAQTVVGAHPIFGETDLRGHIVVGRQSTDDLIKRLFASIGNKHSSEAKAFIGKLRTRLQARQTENEPLTVGDFLGLVGRYANQEFDLKKGAEIATTMAGLSTNNPVNAVSSGQQLRDDNRLDLSYLLRLLQ